MGVSGLEFRGGGVPRRRVWLVGGRGRAASVRGWVGLVARPRGWGAVEGPGGGGACEGARGGGVPPWRGVGSCRVWGLGFVVVRSGFSVLGCGVWGLGFGVQD